MVDNLDRGVMRAAQVVAFRLPVELEGDVLLHDKFLTPKRVRLLERL